MNAILLSLLTIVPGQSASLACAEPVVRRGAVRGGPALEHSFTLTNPSSATIAIVEVRGSCGCLTPHLSQRVLAPGASTRLNVTISTVTQPDGPNVWKVQVKYREGPASPSSPQTSPLTLPSSPRLSPPEAGGEGAKTLDLELHATLVREVGLTPAAVQLIGKPGIRDEVVLTDRRAQPLKLIAVRASSSRLKVQPGAWQQTSAGWQCRLQLQLAEDCPGGTWDETVQLIGDEPGYRELRLPVRIVCRGTQRVLVSPDMVQLRHVPGKASASVLVLLRDAQGQPVEVASVECADAALTARFAEGAHPTASVRLSIAGGKTPQPRSTVKIEIRTPLRETLTLPVEVSGER